jgi:hypothetical protein
LSIPWPTIYHEKQSLRGGYKEGGGKREKRSNKSVYLLWHTDSRICIARHFNHPLKKEKNRKKRPSPLPSF